MDTEIERIWNLFGSLSDALWRRISQTNTFVDTLCGQEYRPQSDEETAIFNELTSPQNYFSPQRYVEFRKQSGSDLNSREFHRPILAEATRRWQGQVGSSGSDRATGISPGAGS
jgi:hypothetical protein